MTNKTHSEAFPRTVKVDRRGAYGRVVLYTQYNDPPHHVDGFIELNTLDEARQAVEALQAVLDEGIEPDQPPAIVSGGYFNSSAGSSRYDLRPEDSQKQKAPPAEKAKQKKPAKQQGMLPGI